jgi:threonine/homoserine/homoserine lactone efflux protein
MDAFIKGMLVSLAITLSIGPGLALQFQASVQRGFKAGFAVMGGRYLSDLSLLFLSYLGILQVVTNSNNRYICGMVGGAALVGFGVCFFMKKTKTALASSSISSLKGPETLYSYFFSSFTINTMNPVVCVFWIGLVAITGANYGLHTQSMVDFFVGLLIAAVGVDLLKCYFFSKINLVLTSSFLGLINRVTGGVLTVAGIGVILKSLSVV